MTESIPTWKSVNEPTPTSLLICEEVTFLVLKWDKYNCPRLLKGFPTLPDGAPEWSKRRVFSTGTGWIQAGSLTGFVDLLADALIQAERERNLKEHHFEREGTELATQLKAMTKEKVIATVKDELKLDVQTVTRMMKRVIEVQPDELDSA